VPDVSYPFAVLQTLGRLVVCAVGLTLPLTGCLDFADEVFGTEPDANPATGPPCPWLAQQGWEDFHDTRCAGVDWSMK